MQQKQQKNRVKKDKMDKKRGFSNRCNCLKIRVSGFQRLISMLMTSYR
jgi:hypothetical protein